MKENLFEYDEKQCCCNGTDGVVERNNRCHRMIKFRRGLNPYNVICEECQRGEHPHNHYIWFGRCKECSGFKSCSDCTLLNKLKYERNERL